MIYATIIERSIIGDRRVVELWLRYPPRAGEVMRFCGATATPIKEAWATREFCVEHVEHEISADWKPFSSAPADRPLHGLTIWVRPLMPMVAMRADT